MQERCFYCDTLLVRFISNRKHRLNPPNGHTRDHLTPSCRGAGKGTVACCCKCNNDKGMLTLDEYRVVRAYREAKDEQAYVVYRDGTVVGFRFPGEK